MEHPQINRVEQTISINPTIPQIEHFLHSVQNAEILSVDIETKKGQLTCIGFAASPSHAQVIPFIDVTRPCHSYWPSIEEEVKALLLVGKLLALPAKTPPF